MARLSSLPAVPDIDVGGALVKLNCVKNDLLKALSEFIHIHEPH